jgi:hypothetical protein
MEKNKAMIREISIIGYLMYYSHVPSKLDNIVDFDCRMLLSNWQLKFKTLF